MKLIYEVQKDDTLCTISRKFNTTCDRIINLNLLTNSDDLKQGDLIVVDEIDNESYLTRMILDIILTFNRFKKDSLEISILLSYLKTIINKKYNRNIDLERNSKWQQ